MQVQEFCDLGTLGGIASSWDMSDECDEQMLERLQLLKDTALGLEELHNNHVVHGDVVSLSSRRCCTMSMYCYQGLLQIAPGRPGAATYGQTQASALLRFLLLCIMPMQRGSTQSPNLVLRACWRHSVAVRYAACSQPGGWVL